jgi:ribulose 1,5-bisphosphate synthetase/thiazole synthase
MDGLNTQMPNATVATKCAIAGGGPAGMMLGYLLARAGVDVACWRSMRTFFAISEVTPFIRQRSN